MARSFSRATTLSAALLLAAVIAGPLASGAAQAGENARHGQSGDLFYNYYATPGYGGVGAELYPCPRPTPPLVGHTYFTYQPLLPHEFLYLHHRTYLRENPGAGWTKTEVKWNRPYVGLYLYPGPGPVSVPAVSYWGNHW
jgi:hypothetical protein